MATVRILTPVAATVRGVPVYTDQEVFEDVVSDVFLLKSGERFSTLGEAVRFVIARTPAVDDLPVWDGADDAYAESGVEFARVGGVTVPQYSV